jgi:hypothetical protein
MARPSPNERKLIDANRAAKAKIKSEVDAREQRTRDRVDQIVTTTLSRTGSRDGLPTVPDLVEKLEKAYALAMATSQPVAAVSATMAIGRLLGLVIDRSAVAIAQVGPERFHGDIEVQREAVFERIRERVGSARAERFITFMQQEMRNGSGDDGVINAVGRTSPWVKNGCGGSSTGTSAVSEIPDHFGAPRKVC